MDESTEWRCLARVISGFAVVMQVETSTSCACTASVKRKIRSFLDLALITN